MATTKISDIQNCLMIDLMLVLKSRGSMDGSSMDDGSIDNVRSIGHYSEKRRKTCRPESDRFRESDRFSSNRNIHHDESNCGRAKAKKFWARLVGCEGPEKTTSAGRRGE